ncbi:hypothetical protein WG909_05065 [Peptostreptococcaceae bacterium AGR-M142]
MKQKFIALILFSILFFYPSSINAQNVYDEIKDDLKTFPKEMQSSFKFDGLSPQNYDSKVDEELLELNVLDILAFDFAYNYYAVLDDDDEKYVKEVSKLDNILNFDMLKHFKNIVTLNICSYYEDVSFPDLSDFKNLSHVYLTAVNLNDFKFIKNCTHIEDFKLYKTNLVNGDLSFLENNQLLELSLVDTNLELENLNFLKNSKKLDFLTIKNTKVKNLDSLNEFKNLTTLDLADLDITNLSVNNLENLFLKNCNIKTTPNDIDFDNLYKVELDNCKISNLDFLNNCAYLEDLIIKNTNLKSFPDLSNTTILDLTLENCKFDDFKDISNCNIINLNIKNMDLSNLDFIDEMTSLESLNIYNSSIDISNINKHINKTLESLSLNYVELKNSNNILDLSNFYDLSALNLKNLDFHELHLNKYTNSTSLIDLSKLTKVGIKKGDGLPIDFKYYDYDEKKEFKSEHTIHFKFENLANLTDFKFLNKYDYKLDLCFDSIPNLNWSDLDKNRNYEILSIVNSPIDINFLNNITSIQWLYLEELNLQTLDINNTNATFEVINIYDVPNLKSVKLNVKTDVLEQSNIRISSCNDLQSLELDVDELYLLYISDCPKFEKINENNKKILDICTINLTNTKINNFDFIDIMPNISTIYIQNENINGFDKLSTISDLNTLDIDTNNITKDQIEKLKQIKNLNFISINDTRYKEEYNYDF